MDIDISKLRERYEQACAIRANMKTLVDDLAAYPGMGCQKHSALEAFSEGLLGKSVDDISIDTPQELQDLLPDISQEIWARQAETVLDDYAGILYARHYNHILFRKAMGEIVKDALLKSGLSAEFMDTQKAFDQNHSEEISRFREGLDILEREAVHNPMLFEKIRAGRAEIAGDVLACDYTEDKDGLKTLITALGARSKISLAEIELYEASAQISFLYIFERKCGFGLYNGRESRRKWNRDLMGMLKRVDEVLEKAGEEFGRLSVDCN